MNKYTYYLLFSHFVIYGCGNNSAEKIQVFSKAEFIQMVDTISIEITSDLLGKYGRFTISEDNYFVGVNHFFNCIDVFSLDKRTFSHSIQFEKRGPNGIPGIGNVIKIGDEYIIKSGSYYYRVSREGLIIKKISLKDSDFFKNGYVYNTKGKGPNTVNFTEISHDIERQCVFKQLYKFREDGNIDTSSYFMCSIDLADWTTDLIKVKYPEPYVESFPKTGFLGDGQMLRNGHFLIFNFPGGNEVYAYDTITQHLAIHDPFIHNRNEMKIDIGDYGNDYDRARLIGQMNSPRYLGVKYNAYSNTYYRVHKTKARKNKMFDVDYFLIKMDSNFNTIAQYNIGDLFYTFQIHDGYLYFAPKDIDKDALHTLKLCRMKG